MDVTTTMTTSAADDDKTTLTSTLIVAVVCFVAGATLLLIGFVRMIIWIVKSRDDDRLSRKRIRQLEHIRHLEEYSIRTAGDPRLYAPPPGGLVYTNGNGSLHSVAGVRSNGGGGDGGGSEPAMSKQYSDYLTNGIHGTSTRF